MHAPLDQESHTDETKATDKKPRAQLSHALIDVDMLHKPKIVAMTRRFGKISHAAYVEILLQISRATDAEIDPDTALGVIEYYEIKDAEAFLKYCLENKLLNEAPNGLITQTRVIEDQESCAKKRKKWREDKTDSATDSTTESTPKKEQNPSKTVKTEDLNTEKKNNKNCAPLEILDFPSLAPDDPTIDHINRWQKYLREKQYGDFGQMSCDALIIEYNGRLSDLRTDINFSMRNKWKTINPKPPGADEKRKSQYAQNFDDGVALAAKYKSEGR